MQGAKVWMADLSKDRLKGSPRRAKTIVVGRRERIKEAEVVVVAAPSPDAQEALEIAGIYGRINFFGLPPQVKLPFSNLIHYKEW